MTTSKGCHVDIVHMVVEFNSLYDARGLGVQTVWTKRLQQAKVSCRVIPFKRHDIMLLYIYIYVVIIPVLAKMKHAAFSNFA